MKWNYAKTRTKLKPVNTKGVISEEDLKNYVLFQVCLKLNNECLLMAT